MKPRRRSTELLFLANSVRVNYQPKGVVGVIGAVELPAVPVGRPAGRGAGRRQPRDDQDVGAVAAHDRAAGEDAGRRLRRRRGRGVRRRGGAGAGVLAPALQPHRLHRLAGGGPPHHARGVAEPDAGDAGTRRQVAGAGVGARRRWPQPPNASPTARPSTADRSASRPTTRWCRAARSRRSPARCRHRSASSTPRCRATTNTPA